MNTAEINPAYVDFYDRSYVIDFCVASFNKSEKNEIFKIYVADALKLITENSGAAVTILSQGNYYGKLIDIRYTDVINNTSKDKGKEKTADEIKNHMKDKMHELFD